MCVLPWVPWLLSQHQQPELHLGGLQHEPQPQSWYPCSQNFCLTTPYHIPVPKNQVNSSVTQSEITDTLLKILYYNDITKQIYGNWKCRSKLSFIHYTAKERIKGRFLRGSWRRKKLLYELIDTLQLQFAATIDLEMKSEMATNGRSRALQRV